MADVGSDWTDIQNDVIVADYFSMLQDELAGRSYNKAEHNRDLAAIVGRGRGAIEFKHQNISAILLCFGQPWILGYKPAANFQASLAEAVRRWLDKQADWLNVGAQQRFAGVAEAAPLWIGPPPTMANTAPPIEPAIYLPFAAKFDAAGRDARNRELGRAGEERILLHERGVLENAGRSDLARRVEWISLRDDTAGFDILSYDVDGCVRMVEVKTTNGWERTPFHISRNECAVAEQNAQTWSLVRLYDFAREPRAFELRPPLERHVELTPTSFLAAIR